MQAQERNPMESPAALLAWENQVRKNIERIDLEQTWTKVEERYSPELGQISYQYAEDLLRIQTIDSTGSRQYYLQGGTLFFARTVHASASDEPFVEEFFFRGTTLIRWNLVGDCPAQKSAAVRNQQAHLLHTMVAALLALR